MLLKHREKFIIPLIYENEYEELCSQIKSNSYFRAVKELKETELHAFINRRFWQDENGHCEIYSVDANHGKDVLLSLYDTEQNISIKLEDIRFYIFKSGIMFMTISAEYTGNGEEVSLYAAEEVNAALKDLYVHKERFLVFDKNIKLAKEKEETETLYACGYLKKGKAADENGRQIVYLAPDTKFKQDDIIEREAVLFVNSETGEYIGFEEGFFVTVKNKTDMIKCYRQGDFSLIDIFEKVTARLKIRFNDYFAGGSHSVLPKKAIVFNMHVLNREYKEDIKEQLFYLAHGYTHNYRYVEGQEHVLTTFDNSFWQVAREGAANINLIEQADSKQFLYQEFENRFNTIYLWILLLVLHQYYGLQYFNCKLLRIYQESLLIDKIEKKKEYTKLLKQMEAVKNEGDLFMLQYVFVDISQITHQNDIYNHIFEVYNIKGLLEDYKTNAEICDKLLAKKQQKALQKKVNFIAAISTFFTLFTAVTQTFTDLFEVGSTAAFVLKILLGIAGLGLVIIGLIKKD